MDIVLSAMVTRHWTRSNALDIDMHVRLFPENDEKKMHDNLGRGIGFALKVRITTLGGSSGGWAPSAGEDYFLREQQCRIK